MSGLDSSFESAVGEVFCLNEDWVDCELSDRRVFSASSTADRVHASPDSWADVFCVGEAGENVELMEGAEEEAKSISPI